MSKCGSTILRHFQSELTKSALIRPAAQDPQAILPGAAYRPVRAVTVCRGDAPRRRPAPYHRSHDQADPSEQQGKQERGQEQRPRHYLGDLAGPVPGTCRLDGQDDRGRRSSDEQQNPQ